MGLPVYVKKNSNKVDAAWVNTAARNLAKHTNLYYSYLSATFYLVSSYLSST